MKRVRITIHPNPNNPSDDLRCAALLRRDLWAHSPVEIDPDSSHHATQRDAERKAYFEFVTDFYDDVERVVQKFGYADRVTVNVIQAGNGTECVNCGNIPPELVTVCPNCGFRDVEPCPYCASEVHRLEYQSIAGDLFRCPRCQRRVRFQFHDPLVNDQGDYNQPLVLVNPAEAPVEHDV